MRAERGLRAPDAALVQHRSASVRNAARATATDGQTRQPSVFPSSGSHDHEPLKSIDCAAIQPGRLQLPAL